MSSLTYQRVHCKWWTTYITARSLVPGLKLTGTYIAQSAGTHQDTRFDRNKVARLVERKTNHGHQANLLI